MLRAKDALAAMAVRHWATMASGIHENQKINEALKLAEEMEKWRSSHTPIEGKLVLEGMGKK